MYCKLFASLYQGTLRGRTNEIMVFTNLLAHATKDGTVDKHFRAIAEETGLSVDDVKTAIVTLESPDEESRSPEAQGARLQRIDEHRVWGWHIVNYAKYRAIRSEDDRAEQNRLAQARWREKNKQSNNSKPSSAESNTDKPKDREKQKEKKEEESLPLPFASIEFKASWEKWTKYRKEIKKPLTPTMIESQLSQLEKMGELRSIAMIEHTIGKGWQGLFEPDQGLFGVAIAKKPKHQSCL